MTPHDDLREHALLTVDEVARILRTSEKAVYDKVSRGRIAGVVRDGRRVLFDRRKLYKSLGMEP
jgi:excisionase family DNA binding protein